MAKVLAIDIGTSGGRHVVGWRDGEHVRTQEVYRFSNGIKYNRDGHSVWNTGALYRAAVRGIKKALALFPDVCSLAIDSRGYDYVLLKGEKAVTTCYAYRDARTAEAIAAVHEAVPFKEMYARTGTAFNTFNTVYQLVADKAAGRLKGVTDFLMIPEYLAYMLTGIKKKESAIGATTGLVNVFTGEFDGESIERLELPAHLFGQLHAPGTVVGDLKPQVAEEVGGNCRVVLCASHDMASAVEGIPGHADCPYILLGPWAQVGVRQSVPHCDARSMAAGYGNEGGVGYVRYQKTSMGTWLVGRLREELCPDDDFAAVVKAAEESGYTEAADVNAPEFLASASIKESFDAALKAAPQTTADYFSCAFHSLAKGYAECLQEMELNVGNTYGTLCMVGKNAFLHRLIERYTGKKVIAFPIEAAVLGNLKIQLGAL